jgi:hypothetical protein
MKERVMVEFGLVLENSKLKEDMGIESLSFSKCCFNILAVDYYRESFDDEGNVEPYTVVILDTGSQLTLDLPYNDFKKYIEKKYEQ